MRAESCPACQLPLMSLRDATPLICLGYAQAQMHRCTRARALSA